MKQRPHRLTRFVTALGGAMALVLIGCFGVVLWIINVSSESIDAKQKEGEQRLLLSVTDDYIKDLANAVSDYTVWDELYEYFEAYQSPTWAHQNLGPYITKTFGIDDVFAVSSSGSIAYRYSRKLHTPQPTAEDRMTLTHLAKLAFDRGGGISGFIVLNGNPALAGASIIRKSSGNSPSHFVLIEAREVNPTFLAKLGREYGIAQLHVEQNAQDGVALPGPTGTPPTFALAWRPAQSGQDLLRRVLPAVAAAGGFALLMLVGLAFLWWRIVEHTRVSESRINQSQLEASEARAQAAEETSKSKSAFIANMSHELRTPLNAIIGFSELLTIERFDGISEAKRRDYTKAILESGRHLLSIVNDILQVSRIEAGKFEPEMRTMCLGQAVDDCVRMVSVLAAQRSIRLDNQIGPSPPMVHADPQALHQILINILSNAIKFSNEHSCVEIACLTDDSAHELQIKDHGCGIPPETLDEIGKPFVQAEGGYNRKYQGTGLGLTICFLLAKAMGASIQIGSVEGIGTAVKVRLAKAAANEVSNRLATDQMARAG